MGKWGSHFSRERETKGGVYAVVIVLELLGFFSPIVYCFVFAVVVFFLMCCLNRYIFHFLKKHFFCLKN